MDTNIKIRGVYHTILKFKAFKYIFLNEMYLTKNTCKFNLYIEFLL